MIDFEHLIERRLHVENDEDSHTEPDPAVWHPSQLSRCKRQATISKYGLEDHDTSTLGTFRIGSIIHEWIEDHFGDALDGVHFEKELEEEWRNGVTVTGRCDVYDEYEDAVYDFKTRSGWYKFDPPNDSHRAQLATYIDMVGAEKGQVVYISKKDLEVRTWPEDQLWTPSVTFTSSIKAKAGEMKSRLEETGQPASVDQVPFNPCGCWLCDREQSEDTNNGT